MHIKLIKSQLPSQVLGSASRLASLRNGIWIKLRGLGLREFAKNAATYSAGTLGAQLICLAIMPAVTRLYGTAPFGIYSVFASIVAILAPIICFRLDFAVPLPVSRRFALALAQAACLSTIAVSILLGIAALGARGRLGVGVFGEVSPFLWWLGLVAPAAGLQLIFTAWNVREREFKTLTLGQIVTAPMISIGQLLSGLVVVGPLGLIVGMVLGQWVGSLSQARTIIRAWRRRPVPSVHLMRRAVSAYRYIAFWGLPTSLFNSVGAQSVPIVVVALFGADIGGLFFIANRIVGLPMGLIGAGLGRVMWAEVAKMRRDRPHKLLPLFWSVSSVAFALFAPGLLFVPFAREIFSFVLGREWGEAGVYAAILFFNSWLGVAAITSSNLTVLGYNHWQTAYECSRLVVLAIIAAVTVIMKLGILQFVVAYSIGWSLCYVGLFVLNLIAIRRTERGDRCLLPTF